MGLCAASKRRLFANVYCFIVEIMAPAITDTTNQTEFSMPAANSDIVNGSGGTTLVLNGKLPPSPETPPIVDKVTEVSESSDSVIKMPPATSSSENATNVVFKESLNLNGYKCGGNGSLNGIMADCFDILNMVGDIHNFGVSSDINNDSCNKTNDESIAKSQKEEVDKYFSAVFPNNKALNTLSESGGANHDNDLEPENVDDVLQVLNLMESSSQLLESNKMNVASDDQYLLPNDEMPDLFNHDNDDDDFTEESIQKSLSLLITEQSNSENRVNQLQMKLRLMQARVIGHRGCKEIEYLLHLMHDKTKLHNSCINNKSIKNELDRIPKFDIKESIRRLDIPALMKSTSGIVPIATLSTIPTMTTTTTTVLPSTSITTTISSSHYNKLSNRRQNNYFHTKINNFGFGSNNCRLMMGGDVVQSTKSLPKSESQQQQQIVAVKLPKLNDDQVADLKQTASMYRSQINWIQNDIDSDQTDSSSEAESCDEMQSFHNPHQQFLSIKERSSWNYARDRAKIGSRWSWTESQLEDIMKRIRQINEHIQTIRHIYGKVELEDVSYSIRMPSSSPTYIPMLKELALAKCQSNVQTSTNTTISTASITSPRNRLGTNQSLESSRNLFDDDIDSTECYQTSRTKPFCTNSGFKKRKLINVNGLHHQLKKVGKASTVRCFCQPPYSLCVLCTGRIDPKLSKDDCRSWIFPDDNIELLDPHFHKNLSTIHDISQSIHLESISKFSEWQQRILKGGLKLNRSVKKVVSESTDNTTKLMLQTNVKVKKADHLPPKRKYTRHGRNPKLEQMRKKGKSKNRKLKLKQYISSFHVGRHALDDAEDEFEEYGSTGLSGHSSAYHRRTRVDSYDIDNIVIPYSVAAATRVEKLQYKEILTPGWRIVDDKFPNTNLSSNINNNNIQESAENVNDESFLSRHMICENAEHKKFSNYLKFPVPIRPRHQINNNVAGNVSGSNANNKRHDPGGDTIIDDHQQNSNDSVSFLRPQSPVAPHSLSQPSTPPLAPSLNSSTVTSQNHLNQNVLEDVPSLVPSSSQTSSTSSSRKSNFIPSHNHHHNHHSYQLQQIYDNVTLPEIAPYENRAFPLSDKEWERMLEELKQDDELLLSDRVQKTGNDTIMAMTSTSATATSINFVLNNSHENNNGHGENSLENCIDQTMEASDMSSIESPSGSPNEPSPEDEDDIDDDEDDNDPEWTVPPGEKTFFNNLAS